MDPIINSVVVQPYVYQKGYEYDDYFGDGCFKKVGDEIVINLDHITKYTHKPDAHVLTFKRIVRRVPFLFFLSVTDVIICKRSTPAPHHVYTLTTGEKIITKDPIERPINTGSFV